MAQTGHMVSKTRAAIAGIVAAVVALGVAELIAALTGPYSAPIVAAGGVVVDSVPEGGKEFAIRLFGTHDKQALLTGTGLLLAVFAALIGIGAARKAWIGYAGIGLFAAIGVAAAVTRPHATWAAALPSLIGSALALPVLFGLLRVERAGDESRRGFVKWAGAATIGALLVGLGGRFLASRKTAETARGEVTLPAPSSAAPGLPANVDPPVKDLERYVTPNRAFYRIDTALVTPQVDPAGWTLKIHGRVRNPITITWEQLLAMPMIERYVTLACVSNEVGGNLISNAKWLGVPVKELLERVQPEDGADQVVSRSVDGWTCGTPTAVLRDGRDAMLAVGMNGEPLPVEHGFPVRMVTPGLYGYVSACKWITEMELSSFDDFDAYWVRRGWANKGPIKTQSRIDTPFDGSKVKAGDAVIAGVAWAQHRGVTVVEVSTDNGATWQQAELAGTVSPDTWRQWTLRWNATPGKHTIKVRAADSTGTVQSPTPVPVAPDGAEGWHTVNVTVN
jgi:DMSO/TMAO reductase YedYZ molybdopterin-dependent catalytic subunit